MTEVIIIWICLIAIGGYVHGENQTIVSHKIGAFKNSRTWFPNWDWWNTLPMNYSNKLIKWLMKYPFAAFRDGFHFTSSLSWWLAQLVPSIYMFRELDLNYFEIWISQLLIFAIFGIAANASLHNWVEND